jgi:hypothetical protein
MHSLWFTRRMGRHRHSATVARQMRRRLRDGPLAATARTRCIRSSASVSWLATCSRLARSLSLRGQVLDPPLATFRRKNELFRRAPLPAKTKNTAGAGRQSRCASKWARTR